MSTERSPERPDFDIVTRWRLDARPEELTAIVLAPELLHLWCGSVFMHAELVENGRADGLGMTIRLHTKGFMPHSFFFVAKIVGLVPHRFMRIAVRGDFEGIGELSVEPDGVDACDARLHWRTCVRHPRLRPFVSPLRPVFVWNHKWAMRRAHRLIQAEIDRRRGATRQPVRSRPVFPHNLRLFSAAQRRHNASRGWLE
jgi:hypothetical protein